VSTSTYSHPPHAKEETPWHTHPPQTSKLEMSPREQRSAPL